MKKFSLSKPKDLFRAKRLLIILMCVTVTSFFVQSMLPPEISSAESDAVSGILELIIPSDTVVGRFVHSNVRKIGHFLEFGIFGAECAIYIFAFTKRRCFDFLVAAVGALFIGLIDETVQIFSGRGPQISDVWLDFFGFACCFAITALSALTALKLIKVNKRKN